MISLGGDDEEGGGGSETDRVDGMGSSIAAALQSLPGGMLAWSYPAVVMAVPGLLLVIAVLAQTAGALAWLPVVRRSLGGTGVRRRKQQGHRSR